MALWKVLPLISASMSFQMALDEVLFRERESEYLEEDPEKQQSLTREIPPLLRFYVADRPSVTVGYSHKSVLPEAGKPLIRRITGGGIVEHGRDLIFSLVAHKRHDESFHSVRVSYWKIHEALKAGFESLGLKPRFYRCDEELPEGPECFRYPISSDLALGDHKIAGGSQKRSAGTLLHQESIVVPKRVDFYRLAKAFERGFESIFKISCSGEPVKPEWMSKAKILSETKYQPLIAASVS